MDANETFGEYVNSLPHLLTPKTRIQRVNEPLIIYDGSIGVRIDGETAEVGGQVRFSWAPEPSIRISAVSDHVFYNTIIDEVVLPGRPLDHGDAFVTRSGGVAGKFDAFVNGPFVIREEKGEADTLWFEIANFRSFMGERVQYNGGFYSMRLAFHTDELSVVIDQVINHSEVIDELKEHGGYGLTCTGKITSATPFSYNGSKAVIDRLGLFLTFLNGRRAYPCFLVAKRDGKVVWKDYSAFFTDRYKECDSWLPQQDHSAISVLWAGFIGLLNDPDDRNCIDYLIHWYVEANNNAAFAEGSIVLLQNAFELLFNWQIVEKKGLITKPQLKKNRMNADEKIRMLFKSASIDPAIPRKNQNVFAAYRQTAGAVSDFPKIFTEVRNAIVHSDVNKRGTLKKVSSMMRFHIRQLGLHYLELLILNLCGYQGKYTNRASENMFRGGNEEIVPWSVDNP